MNAPTRLFITGGTIDKRYNMLDGTMSFERTHLPAMLKQARYIGSLAIDELFMKDSLDMIDEHRMVVARAVAAAKEDKIVITHGTDTMVQTGKTINAQEIGNKTIVLTGAMIPYSLGTDSDAQFNLGTAFAYVQALPPGVYVAMNGQSFDIDNVYKDTKAGIFVPLES